MIKNIEIKPDETHLLSEKQDNYMEYSFCKKERTTLKQTTHFIKCRELFSILPLIDMVDFPIDVTLYNYSLDDGYIESHTKDTTILLLNCIDREYLKDKIHYINELESKITQINKVTKSIPIVDIEEYKGYIALEIPKFWIKNVLTLSFYTLVLRCLLVLPKDTENIEIALNKLSIKCNDTAYLNKIYKELDLLILFNNIDTIVDTDCVLKEFEDCVIDNIDQDYEEEKEICENYLYLYTQRGIQTFVNYISRRALIKGVSKENALFKEWIKLYIKLIEKSKG